MTPKRDSGFSLIETMVAMSIIGSVMLFTTFAFVRAQGTTRLQGEWQSAAQMAQTMLDELQATPYAALTQKANTANDGVAAAALSTAVTTAGALASGSDLKTASGIEYKVSWYAVPCTTSGCTLTVAGLVSVPMLQLAVAVSWAAKECTDEPQGRCVFTTQTLVSPITEADGDGITLPTIAVTPSIPALPTVPTTAPTTTPPATATPSPTPAGPVPAAIWAMTNFSISSSMVTITGAVHSNKAISFTGSTGTISPSIEYGTTYSKAMSAMMMNTPAAVKVTASTPPIRAVADYKPTGAKAVAAGSGYKAISCTAGSTWAYSAATVGSATIVYVPCNVTIANQAVSPKVLLVAEGTITVNGSSATFGDSANPAATGLISNSTSASAITLSGSMSSIYGQVQALQGGVVLSGSIVNVRCGIIGDTITMSGGIPTITVDSGCAQ